MRLLAKYKLEAVIFLIIVALYFLLRLPNLTLQPIFADEAIYIRWAQVMKSEPTLRFLPLSDGKTPLFMWVMMPLFKVFEDPLFAGRFLSVVSGFFTLMGVYFLSRKIFGVKAAFWAALLYVTSPYTVFFDRMALVDSMLSAFSIWALYFALWLVKSNRLDLAMILGFILGGGVLTKTPGVTNILILPLTLLTFIRKKDDKHKFIKLLLFLVISIIIALIVYNLLRLGPGFTQLSNRNQDYVFAPLELVGRPLDPFIPHFRDLSDWFPKLLTLPVLLVMGYGLHVLGRDKNRLGWVVLLWALIPLLLEMAFLKTFTARYLLSSIAPFLIFAGVGLAKILDSLNKSNLIKIVFGMALILPLALKFDYELIISPPPKDLPLAERRGYFEDWTAGYGFSEIAEFLKKERGKGKVVVGTEGFFGTLPDGLYIYLDKADISIVGSHATISAQIREAALEHQTFFVGNKSSLEGSIKNVKLIKEYPKVGPKDGKKADAVVLYQVLPE